MLITSKSHDRFFPILTQANKPHDHTTHCTICQSNLTVKKIPVLFSWGKYKWSPILSAKLSFNHSIQKLMTSSPLWKSKSSLVQITCQWTLDSGFQLSKDSRFHFPIPGSEIPQAKTFLYRHLHKAHHHCEINFPKNSIWQIDKKNCCIIASFLADKLNCLNKQKVFGSFGNLLKAQ